MKLIAKEIIACIFAFISGGAVAGVMLLFITLWFGGIYLASHFIAKFW